MFFNFYILKQLKEWVFIVNNLEKSRKYEEQAESIHKPLYPEILIGQMLVQIFPVFFLYI